jgi:hypothetical protein
MTARQELALGAILVLNLVDLVATVTWLSLGLAHEANPLMRAAWSAHPAAFALAKVALVSLACLVLARTSVAAPRLTLAVSSACGAFYAALACYHAAGGAL